MALSGAVPSRCGFRSGVETLFHVICLSGQTSVVVVPVRLRLHFGAGHWPRPLLVCPPSDFTGGSRNDHPRTAEARPNRALGRLRSFAPYGRCRHGLAQVAGEGVRVCR